MSLLAGATPLMGSKNVSLAFEGNTLYILCDLSVNFGASGSGKSVVVASSSGNKALGKSGAMLGLNIFTKSVESQDLTEVGIGSLRTPDFEAVGDGCGWRVAEGTTTLVIKIDFDAVKPRAGSTGKSMLLATTSGNKPIAKSGIMCGLNCYYAMTATFDVSQLSAGMTAETAIKVGYDGDIGNGFRLQFMSPTRAVIQRVYDTEAEESASTISLPASTHLGEVTLAMHLLLPKAKKVKKDPAEEAPKPEADSKARNATVTCMAAEESGTKYSVSVEFDPTKEFGRSSTGKTLTVASTAGFMNLCANGKASGEVVCRMSFTANRPAPAIREEEVGAAVKAILSSVKQEDFATISVKSVLGQVLSELKLPESMLDTIKEVGKKCIMEFMQDRASANKENE